MTLVLVLAAIALCLAWAGLRLTLRARAEAQRLRALNAVLEARVAERTRVLRRALTAAEASLDGLGARDADQSAFLARLSHELRTPLNAVLGFSHLLLTDRAELLTPRQAQAAAAIRDGGRRLLAFVDATLDAGRPAPGWAPDASGTVADRPVTDAVDPPPPSPLAPHMAKTIVYVEDHPVNVALMRRITEAMGGVDLHVAGSATEGLAMARALRPDLILLDLNLPDMDGFDVKARLDADPLTRDVPVVAVTADALPATARRGRQAGMAGWVIKPIDVPAFAATLSAALSPAEPEPTALAS
jgi:CheY-like chemotaxis protein